MEIIREALAAWLAAAEKAEPLPPLTSDPLWTNIGTVPGGPADESESHDALLYGERVAKPETSYEGSKPSARRSKKPRKP